MGRRAKSPAAHAVYYTFSFQENALKTRDGAERNGFQSQ